MFLAYFKTRTLLKKLLKMIKTMCSFEVAFRVHIDESNDTICPYKTTLWPFVGSLIFPLLIQAYSPGRWITINVGYKATYDNIKCDIHTAQYWTRCTEVSLTPQVDLYYIQVLIIFNVSAGSIHSRPIGVIFVHKCVVIVSMHDHISLH